MSDIPILIDLLHDDHGNILPWELNVDLTRISHTGEQCGGNGGREVGDVEQAQ
jgi:hypothetical protein